MVTLKGADFDFISAPLSRRGDLVLTAVPCPLSCFVAFC
jgi:hypothetical protein